MGATAEVTEICSSLVNDPRIAHHLLSVIWIGSRSSGRDVHAGSDIDLQLILDKSSAATSIALSEVLGAHQGLDLSILYVKDVFAADGTLDFQDCTKGPFFIPVLAAGKVILGIDFYSELRGRLTLPSAAASLRFTIREYLGRLRVMVVQDKVEPFEFKKYVFKYIKDLLVYRGFLDLNDMPFASNVDIIQICETASIFQPTVVAILKDSMDYSVDFNIERKCLLLEVLETAYDALPAPGSWGAGDLG